MQDLLTIKQASHWATQHTGRHISPANIAYLIQYGRVAKCKNGQSSATLISKIALQEYYKNNTQPKKQWQQQLGADLNWHLSFAQYKESETTKHVHRLHPYKGKFIPQLVEYFLDKHTDKFKNQVFFNAGDTILDPFCGSGTTLVVANELGINAIGVDISEFNVLISNAKITNYDIGDILKTAQKITQSLKKFQQQRQNVAFERELLEALKQFNQQFFPTPDFKYRVRQKTIDENFYSKQKSSEFLVIYQNLVKKHNIKLKQAMSKTFTDKWFLQVVRDEIDFVFAQIKNIQNVSTKKILSLILSRTMRSCRATTHADLGTLKTPITQTYYCKKHSKICKPLFSVLSWWRRYTQDTIKRLGTFYQLKTSTLQTCLIGDSRSINIAKNLQTELAPISQRKIAGIFSSPPYVGLIDYHQQHAYAYDLFGFDRKDSSEIGPLFRGQGLAARKSYIKGVADVLNNSKKFLKENYHVFLVANDRYNLYPEIAQLAGMKIVNQYKRPVLNRVEKNRAAYAEIIFHLKEG